MDVASDIAQKAVSSELEFEAFGLLFEPSYLQAGLIVFLLFVLVLTLARLRRMYVNWSLKGAWGMIGVGFFLALILEGFLLIGGRTIFTEILGWKNAPKPFSTALDVGRGKLVNVLGVTEQIPNSSASSGRSSEDVVAAFQSLSPDEAKTAKSLICSPQ